jgi:predicted type IV restriction endonuclease
MPLWIPSFVPFNYCWENKVQYFVITDGERWEVYDMKKMGGEVIDHRQSFGVNPNEVKVELSAQS